MTAAPPLVEQLQCETWFHGSISRREAERLLGRDGDFLVRESGTTPGQYVLTGQQGGQPKHLLLVDPEGVVSPEGNAGISHAVPCPNLFSIFSTEGATAVQFAAQVSGTAVTTVCMKGFK